MVTIMRRLIMENIEGLRWGGA